MKNELDAGVTFYTGFVLLVGGPSDGKIMKCNLSESEIHILDAKEARFDVMADRQNFSIKNSDDVTYRYIHLCSFSNTHANLRIFSFNGNMIDGFDLERKVKEAIMKTPMDGYYSIKAVFVDIEMNKIETNFVLMGSGVTVKADVTNQYYPANGIVEKADGAYITFGKKKCLFYSASVSPDRVMLITDLYDANDKNKLKYTKVSQLK